MTLRWIDREPSAPRFITHVIYIVIVTLGKEGRPVHRRGRRLARTLLRRPPLLHAAVSVTATSTGGRSPSLRRMPIRRRVGSCPPYPAGCTSGGGAAACGSPSSMALRIRVTSFMRSRIPAREITGKQGTEIAGQAYHATKPNSLSRPRVIVREELAIQKAATSHRPRMATPPEEVRTGPDKGPGIVLTGFLTPFPVPG
jgi:hypothetical protein